MADEVVPELAPKLPTTEVQLNPELAREGDIKSLTSEEESKFFEQLLQDAKSEDRFVRDEFILIWKRLQYYWDNVLDIFYDPVAREWRVPDWDELIEEGETPPRLINIYRPHGEAIVAALTVTLPPIYFHPKDADNPDDVEASRAYRAIADLLALHNDAALLFIKVIVKFFNQGTVFGYNYYKKDGKYGSYSKPKIENRPVETFNAICPNCGGFLDSNMKGAEQVAYECPICSYMGPAEIEYETENLPQIVGEIEEIKGSVCQDIYSGLNVKVSMSARSQYECGYLLLSFFQSVPLLMDILQSVFDDEGESKGEKIQGRQYRNFEDFFTLPVQYAGSSPENSAVVDCLWLRPWQFWQLGKEKKEEILLLKQKYPEGCYALFVNEMFIEAVPESMDDHWTISANPFGDFIYGKPLGENLATVQDIRAQLVEIELQTAEHGIPETFVDGKVVDLEAYGQGRAKPGMVTAAKPRAGKSLGDAFHTTKTAILSQEIDPLRQHIDQDAQFVTGSFPSVYGGPSSGGSKTAAEYAQSKAMALQRLGTFYKIAVEFWANFQARSVVEYASILKAQNRNEQFTKRVDGDSFINVWITTTSLSGRVGRVEPEAADQLPVSWAAKKDAVMQLIQFANPDILAVLTHPNNAFLMKQIIGLNEIYVPGEESRLRQRKEIVILAQGMMVPTNPEVDNEEIHVEVLRSYLESPAAEVLSEEGLQACMMHLQMHQESLAQKAMQEAMMLQSGAAPENESNKENENVQ